MHFIAPNDRTQLTFLGKLDDLVAEENPVRLLDLIVDQIVISNINRFTQKGQSELGRKAFHPATLSKLYLYGYFNGISSSRKLEAESHRNIELIWLLGNLKPDHKTIADYRKDHDQEIRFITLEFRRFLIAKGYITGTTISLDGTKIKAYTNRDMLSLDGIENRLNNLQVKLDQYLKRLQGNDLEEDLLDEVDHLPDEESKEFLINKIVQLENQLEELNKSKEVILSQNIKTISSSDPDARLMKSRDGMIPGYNTQVVVDSENKMIVLAEVTNKQADQDLLKPSIDQLNEQLAITPEQVFADKGYYNPSQIKDIEESEQTICYVPPQSSAKKVNDDLSHISFVYNEIKDEYTCSQGRTLALNTKNKIKKNRIADVYIGKECDGCPKKSECTQSKKGRILHKYKDETWVEQYKERMKGQDAKQMIQMRKELSEHIFGTIKYLMGKIPLLLRSQNKAQIEIDIYTTSYNFKRLTNLKSIEIIINEVNNYNWKAK